MSHTHILVLIDAYLERLHAARNLLSSLHALPGEAEALVSEARKTRVPRKARPAMKKKRVADHPLLPLTLTEQTIEEKPAQVVLQAVPAAPPAPPPVMPPVVRLASARQRERVAKPAPVRAASALVGHIPAGPVFVPAGKVLQDHLLRTAEASTQRAAEPVPLTPELLAQRWLQNYSL